MSVFPGNIGFAGVGFAERKSGNDGIGAVYQQVQPMLLYIACKKFARVKFVPDRQTFLVHQRDDLAIHCFEFWQIIGGS